MSNWFLDTKRGAWFKDEFANADYNPIAVTVFDGDLPDDRILLLGGEDGYIHAYSADSAEDDGAEFEASAILGPLRAETGPYVTAVLVEVRPQMDANSTAILYEALAGDTPEVALAKEDVTFTGDGLFTAGVRRTHNPKVAGRHIYIKVGTAAANSQWSIERLHARLSLATTSKKRFRAAD